MDSGLYEALTDIARTPQEMETDTPFKLLMLDHLERMKAALGELEKCPMAQKQAD
jgi:hypothetical protein